MKSQVGTLSKLQVSCFQNHPPGDVILKGAPRGEQKILVLTGLHFLSQIGSSLTPLEG